MGTVNTKIHKKSRYKIVGHFPSTLAEYRGKTVTRLSNPTTKWFKFHLVTVYHG